MVTPLLEVEDRWGRSIQLADVVWAEHILNHHSDLIGHLDAVRETLINPDIVTFDAVRSDTECYYRHGAIEAVAHRPFKVVVRFIRDGRGHVRTAYIIRQIQKGELIKWQR